MKNLVTVMTAAALTMGVAGTSQADEEVAFKYKPSESASEIYSDLNRQAKRLCKDELGAFARLNLRECMKDYVGQIVGKINRVELTAYHNRMIGKEDIIYLAEKKK